MRPHIYRTHDGGKTWTEIVAGIPNGETVNAVREDPKRKGLLFAGTERTVYVSFDDGARWQSLRLNMPASSMRDLIVKDDDLVVATHGRGFWILDDITPLRQIDATSEGQAAILFKPTTAWRVRWNTSTDMPWPVEEPTGMNPPDGAIINYYLKSAAAGPVTLEILQQDGRLVRRYSSADPVTPIPDAPSAPVPIYWYRPPQSLSTAAGMHRFIWDVHYQPLPAGGGGGGRGGLPIAAIPYNTAPGPGTPWANPGTYTLKLTVDGKSYTQPITVKQDPRVKTPALAMQQVYSLTKAMYFGAVDAQQAALALGAMRAQATALAAKAQGPAAAALAAFEKKAAALEGQRPAAGGGQRGGGGGGQRGGAAAPAAPPDTLWAVAGLLSGQMNSMQAADVAPTSATLAVGDGGADGSRRRDGQVERAQDGGSARAERGAEGGGVGGDRLLPDEVAAAGHDVALRADELDVQLVPAGRRLVRRVRQHVPRSGVVEHQLEQVLERQARRRTKHASARGVGQRPQKADLELRRRGVRRRAEAGRPDVRGQHAVAGHVGALGRVDHLLRRGGAGVVAFVGEHDDNRAVVLRFAHRDRLEDRVVERRVPARRRLGERGLERLEVARQLLQRP